VRPPISTDIGAGILAQQQYGIAMVVVPLAICCSWSFERSAGLGGTMKISTCVPEGTFRNCLTAAVKSFADAGGADLAADRIGSLIAGR
jgi:hypothetical protein